jgi:hypothetical protein
MFGAGGGFEGLSPEGFDGIGVEGFDLHCDDGGWMLSLGCFKSERVGEI